LVEGDITKLPGPTFFEISGENQQFTRTDGTWGSFSTDVIAFKIDPAESRVLHHRARLLSQRRLIAKTSANALEIVTKRRAQRCDVRS
jgi:hypothetical protein